MHPHWLQAHSWVHMLARVATLMSLKVSVAYAADVVIWSTTLKILNVLCIRATVALSSLERLMLDEVGNKMLPVTAMLPTPLQIAL